MLDLNPRPSESAAAEDATAEGTAAPAASGEDAPAVATTSGSAEPGSGAEDGTGAEAMEVGMLHALVGQARAVQADLGPVHLHGLILMIPARAKLVGCFLSGCPFCMVSNSARC